MRFLTTSIYLLAVSISASAGTISGTVYDPFGRGLPNAPLQAKNEASGAVFKAASGASGSYAMKDLPAGTYNVTVSIAGLKGFSRSGLNVTDTQSAALDIHIEETSQLSTLGEDTTAITADTNKHKPPSGPTPRMKDGKPDLSGIWWRPTTVDNGKQEFLPNAVAVAKQREETNRKDSPQAHCLPGAILRLGPVYETVQNGSVMVVISDDDSPGFHQIYIDGRGHPRDPTPAWYGSSVGHWEGDTLVVDRVAFEDRVWLDQGAHPHSDKLHIVERYRRPDLGHLETETTVEDSGVLAKPFTMKTVSDLAPTEEVLEFICTENNRDVEHLVGK